MSNISNHNEFRELRHLTLQALDGSISREQIAKLEEILLSGPRARLYYRSFLAMYADLDTLIENKSQDDESINGTLLKLAELEGNAPELIIETSSDEPDNCQEAVSIEKKTYRVDKYYKVYRALLAVAAVIMVMFIVYVNIYPPKPAVATATITDSFDASWAEQYTDLNIGSRLNTYGPQYTLERGMVELSYDYGSTVIVEAPAVFSVGSENVLMLYQGSIFASVKDGCKGFTVKTPSSILVDIGTEFGVDVNDKGDSQLHVYKGEVVLSTIPANDNKAKVMHFTAGQGAGVEKDKNEVNFVTFRNDFMQDISKPVFFEDFESLPVGQLLDNQQWSTTINHKTGPVIDRADISGNYGLRGIKRTGSSGGAGHHLPKQYDLANLTEPLYVSCIMKADGKLEEPGSKKVILTLSEIGDDNTSSGYIEGDFDLERGVRFLYASGSKTVKHPQTDYAGEEMTPGSTYLCVMKFMPAADNKCEVSIGCLDLSINKCPDQENMQYQYSAIIDPAEMTIKGTDSRYYASHIAISVYSEDIIADNLIVTEQWGHIRSFSNK